MDSLKHLVLPLGLGAGIVLVLEVGFFVLVRTRRPPRSRLLYQLWALSAGGAAAAYVWLRLYGSGANVWKLTGSVAALLGAVVLFSLFDSLVVQRPWAPARGPLMPKLALDVLRVGVLLASAFVVATAILDYPLPAVLVSSTVLSAVIGLALQDVLKNVFAGMALELERPFARGDWLLFDGKPARVIDTSWRSTRLRDNEGVEYWEPNASFSTSRLVNYGSGATPVAIRVDVGLPYDVPPNDAKAALEAAAANATLAAKSPAPRAFLLRYGDSAIEYSVRAWTPNVAELVRFRDAVGSRIWYELRRRGLNVPFPIRTLQMEDVQRHQEQRLAARSAGALALLSGLDLFSGLDQRALARLAGSAQHHLYDAGEVLVREGDEGDSLFVVSQGTVMVTKSGRALGTSEVTLASLGRGDFFGEMSLLTGEPRSATVVAQTPCEVLVLDRAQLAKLLHDEPHLAEVLSSAVETRQAGTRRTFDDRKSNRVLDDAPSTDSVLHRIRSFFKLGG